MSDFDRAFELNEENIRLKDELVRLHAELEQTRQDRDGISRSESKLSAKLAAAQAEVTRWRESSIVHFDALQSLRANHSAILEDNDRLRAELAAARESSSMKHLFRLQETLPVESGIGLASGWNVATTILIEYIEKLKAALNPALQQAAEAGALEMKHICKSMAEDWDWRKSGDNTNLDIAIGIDEIDPAAVARVALQALGEAGS